MSERNIEDIKEKTLKELQQEKIQMFISKIASMRVRDFYKEQTLNSRFKKYTKDDITELIQNPARNEIKIREISQFLYITSSHYKRLVDYFANMHLLRYTLKPININPDVKKVNINKFKKTYLETSDYIGNMNIEHEFRKIMTVCFREDIFYGYEHETDTSYFIQQLDSNYCQISSIEDGIYNFSFDFSYFNDKKQELEYFPKEFKSKYNKYLKDKSLKWQELDSKKTICIKINQDFKYAFPPFIGVFEEVYNIEDYKALKKAKKELENYQLLGLKIPMKGEEQNDFMLDLDLANQFYEKVSESIPDNVGLFLTPMDAEPMKFEQDKVNSDAVIEAEDLFWSTAGVNGNLFNSKGNSGSVVSLSTKTDESIVFALTRQIERWVNRKLKFKNNKFQFKFRFLDVTINNEKDKSDELLKLAQYGIPVKMDIAQVNGVNVSEMQSSIWLENEVFDLTNNLKPLMSSHTQSGDIEDGENGRKKKSDEEISDKGEQSREIDAHKSDGLVSE